MGTTLYSNLQGSKSRQNTCQVQSPESIGNLYAPRRCLGIRTAVSTVWSAATISESEFQAINREKTDCITYMQGHTHINWLPSRFSLSVETRRRYGWLRMMVFPGAHLFRAPIWCPSGGWRHARGREHCRGEPGSSLSGGYAPDSAKAEGGSIVDEPGEG